MNVINAAVARAPGTIRLGVRDNPGDSASSLMLADNQQGWMVSAITLDDVLAEIAPTRPLFVKIDIEGFEFELLDEIIRRVVSRKASVYLSLHPHVFELRATAVGGTGWLARLRRSILKRTVGRTVGRRAAVAATANLVERLSAVRIVDESGGSLDPATWVGKVRSGKNVTASGAVVLLP